MDKETFFQVGYLLQNQDFIIYTNNYIGSGAQGKVFECKRKNFANQNESLCAKISTIIKEEEKLALQEGEILQSLQNDNNKNLVKIFFSKYQNLNDKKVLITIMERCQSNLQQMQNSNNVQMSEEGVEDFLIQILSGYRSLYDKNIVHRDLKPENILLNYQGNQITYKIADFGIGKICKFQDKNKDLTKIGTPQYTAPESNTFCDSKDFIYSQNQLKQSYLKNWKSQCDIYSIGLIVHQLIFGKLPFQDKQTALIQFFETLKKNKTFTLPFNLKNEKIINFLRGSLVYLPHERIIFEKAFELFEIPSKPKINQFNQFPKVSDAVQAQFASRIFTPRVENQPVFGNLPASSQLQVNVYDDSSKYLKQQLAQNESFFCPSIKSWFLRLIKAIESKDNDALQSNKEELQKSFLFSDETSRNYSIDYLKFIFSINYLIKTVGCGLKVEAIHKFQSELDLKQNIKKVLY